MLKSVIPKSKVFLRGVLYFAICSFLILLGMLINFTFSVIDDRSVNKTFNSIEKSQTSEFESGYELLTKLQNSINGDYFHGQTPIYIIDEGQIKSVETYGVASLDLGCCGVSPFSYERDILNLSKNKLKVGDVYQVAIHLEVGFGLVYPNNNTFFKVGFDTDLLEGLMHRCTNSISSDMALGACYRLFSDFLNTELKYKKNAYTFSNGESLYSTTKPNTKYERVYFLLNETNNAVSKLWNEHIRESEGTRYLRLGPSLQFQATKSALEVFDEYSLIDPRVDFNNYFSALTKTPTESVGCGSISSLPLSNYKKTELNIILNDINKLEKVRQLVSSLSETDKDTILNSLECLEHISNEERNQL